MNNQYRFNLVSSQKITLKYNISANDIVFNDESLKVATDKVID